jgi:hypothetical protein
VMPPEVIEFPTRIFILPPGGQGFPNVFGR